MITNNYKPATYGKGITELIISGGKYKGTLLVDSNKTIELREHKFYLTRDRYTLCSHCNRSLHRILVGAKAGDIVDHKSRNTLDNRLKNLRIVTHAENMRNRAASKNSLVPVKGVWLDKEKWVAEITYNGRKRLLGRYELLYDAVCHRIRSEIELFREMSINYKPILKNIPKHIKLSWFPEIYGKDNSSYLEEDFVKNYFTHSRDVNNKDSMRKKFKRYKNEK